MLGKLLIYEFKGTYKKILIILLLTVGAYTSLMLTFNYLINLDYYNAGQNPTAWLFLKIIIELIAIYAGFIYGIITIFKRFYSSIFGKYAYFNMSLPVKPYAIVLSKLIVIVCSSALIGFGYLGSTYFIFRDSPYLGTVKELVAVPGEYSQLVSFIEQFISIKYLIYLSASAVYFVVLIYFCITLGSTMKNRGAGIAIGIVSYVVISSVVSYLDIYILIPQYFGMIFSMETYYIATDVMSIFDVKVRFMASALMYLTLSALGFFFIIRRIKNKLSLR